MDVASSGSRKLEHRPSARQLLIHTSLLAANVEAQIIARFDLGGPAPFRFRLVA